MACRSRRRAWSDAGGDLVRDPRSWVIGVGGLGLFAFGVVVKTSSLGLPLVVLGVGLFALGVLLPLVTEAEVGPGGLKLKKTLRDWDEEFEPFIRAEHERFCRFAALLSQAPPAQVNEFVDEAYSRAYVLRTGTNSKNLSSYLLCTLVQIILGAKQLHMLEVGGAGRPAGTDNWLDAQVPRLRGIAAIPLEPRAILLLRHQQLLPIGEIAAFLNHPPRTVESVLRRAEATLKQMDGSP